MPQQLIYTSAPRGVVAGRSGYCTVARSASMREPVMLRLEQLSYYQHLSIGGVRERPIFAYRIVDIRGSRFHVLTRLQDAGLDFTGRTNFTAHHLVFTPEELPQLPVPAIILRDWPGWTSNWSREPQLLSNEDWGNLTSLVETRSLPARTWQRVTGDAINGYALLEVKAGVFLNGDGVGEKDVLTLLAESAELLEVRDTRRDFRIAAWQFTFTTCLQEQDNTADFRWRFVQRDTPASVKMAGTECPPLVSFKCSGFTEEEASLARTGRQKPAFVKEPEDTRFVEGHTLSLRCQATGVPIPDYDWYEVDRTNNAKGPVGHGPDLSIAGLPLGVSRFVVRASNSAGEVVSRVAQVSVEAKMRVQRHLVPARSVASRAEPSYVKSAEDIQRQRNKLELEKAEQLFRRRQTRKVVLGLALSVLAVLAMATLAMFKVRRSSAVKGGRTGTANAASAAVTISSNHVLGMGPGALATTASNFDNQAASNTPFAEGGVPAPANLGSPAANAGVKADTELTSLPQPWGQNNIGNPIEGVFAGASGPAFIMKASGKCLKGTADNFFFLRRPATNSRVQFTARVRSLDRGAHAGIMLRDSDQVDAAFVYVGVAPTGLFVLTRPTNGLDAVQAKLLTGLPPLPHSVPAWLRLFRNEASFVAQYSQTGTNWLPIANCGASMLGTNYLLGMVVLPATVGSAVKTEFDNVTIEFEDKSREALAK